MNCFPQESLRKLCTEQDSLLIPSNFYVLLFLSPHILETGFSLLPFPTHLWIDFVTDHLFIFFFYMLLWQQANFFAIISQYFVKRSWYFHVNVPPMLSSCRSNGCFTLQWPWWMINMTFSFTLEGHFLQTKFSDTFAFKQIENICFTSILSLEYIDKLSSLLKYSQSHNASISMWHKRF